MTSSEPSAPGPITVLRLGHRRGRDPRISTHVGLVARAFGANRFLLAGEPDVDVLSNLREVSKRFGGELKGVFSLHFNGSGCGRFQSSDNVQ